MSHKKDARLKWVKYLVYLSEYTQGVAPFRIYLASCGLVLKYKVHCCCFFKLKNHYTIRGGAYPNKHNKGPLSDPPVKRH